MPDDSIQYLKLSKPARRVFAVDLPKLPGTIRIFAEIFEIHFRTTRREVWNRNRFAPQAQALSQLINLVREETGEPRVEMLASILTAAATVAGTNQIFHAESLKRLDQRQRKRPKNISTLTS